MHAKMTRDRKKLFINSVEKTIAELEQNNARMRAILAKQAIQHSSAIGSPDNSSTKSVTPEPSPMLVSSDVSTTSVPPLSSVPITVAEVEKKQTSDVSAASSVSLLSTVAVSVANAVAEVEKQQQISVPATVPTVATCPTTNSAFSAIA